MGYYSLLDKFRGALLGNFMGKSLRIQDRQLNPKKLGNDFLRNANRQNFAWSTQDVISILQEPPNKADIWERKFCKFYDSKNTTIESKLNIFLRSALPIILYYHDYWSNLANFLIQQVQTLQTSPEEIDDILVWCYVTRLALRGELVSGNLTRQVVMGTGLKRQTSILWLKKVEISCLNGLSARQLLQELSPKTNVEIPLSLFCFLNNPENMFLTVQQALSLEKQGTNITALSSILSGAYNGLRGIPVIWLNICQYQDIYPKIMDETQKMIGQWLGSDGLFEKSSISSTIHAPKTLQSRPSLKIISQQEYESISI